MDKGMIKIANYDVQHLVSEFDANKDRFYNSTVESDVKWSSLTLYGLDEQNSKTTATLQNNDQASWTTAASHFPETVKFLQQLDFKYQFVVLQKLDPQGKVEKHTDPSNGYERYFLYIQSPPGFEFEIDGNTQIPKNGDMVVIDPSLPHRAINNSVLPRYQIMFYAIKK